MAARKIKSQTPVEAAQAHVEEVQSTIAALAEEISPLVAEREQLQSKALLQPSEVDRLADLADGSLPRREQYLAKLQEETLPEARASLRRVELLALAEDSADGIEAKHKHLESMLADAEERVSQIIADARREVEEWNDFIRPVIKSAEQAGQDSRNPADPDHPVNVVINSMYPYRALYVTVEGEIFRPRDADRAVLRIASKADDHTARMIRLGVEEETFKEARRGRWS